MNRRQTLWILSVLLHRAFADLEPCSHLDVAHLPFCNASLPAIDRAKDLVSRLDTFEKIAQLMDSAPAIDRLHIDGYNYWTEGLHGILSYCTADGRCPTSYPMPIGVAATFNRTLVKLMASQISSEGRRLFVDNAGGKLDRHLVGLNYWSPNINIFRDPRWGRGMETPGEDPYLSGQYAIMYVKGMQQGEDPRYLKAVSTLKHFAGYSLEGWHQYNRMGFDAIISDEDLVQTYLPAFEAAIKQGHAGGVMCSYNAVNGVPSCANSFLLKDILRQQWGWDGYVVSDCGAVGYVYRPHNYAHSPEEAASVAMQAGTDLNCGYYYKYLAQALRKDLIQERDLDVALIRLFTMRIRLGLFDPWSQQPYMQYPPETVGHPTHKSTALQIARESIVLLKNDNGTLPLDRNCLRKIAVLGPHFDSTAALCGNYHGSLPPMISPFQAIQSVFTAGQVKGVKGCDISSNSTADFDTAMSLARDADVAILFMGINPSVENEGKDREHIGLTGVQEDFIKTIGQVQNKIVLVLINGGSLDISSAKENPNVGAILEAFYPGMKGGEAIADVLFGNYNPSGRLPYTMHKNEFVDQISMADMSMTKYPGRTYRYFRGEVVYPFGHGLSYTTFICGTELLGANHVDNEHAAVDYRVIVKNSGDVAGDVSVLAFLSFKGSTEDYSCPRSQLFAFQKLHLRPGENKEIFFSVTPAALNCYKEEGKGRGSPQGWYSVRIGENLSKFYLGNAHNVKSPAYLSVAA